MQRGAACRSHRRPKSLSPRPSRGNGLSNRERPSWWVPRLCVARLRALCPSCMPTQVLSVLAYGPLLGGCAADRGPQAGANPVWQQDQPNHQGHPHGHPQAEGGEHHQNAAWVAEESRGSPLAVSSPSPSMACLCLAICPAHSPATPMWLQTASAPSFVISTLSFCPSPPALNLLLGSPPQPVAATPPAP